MLRPNNAEMFFNEITADEVRDVFTQLLGSYIISESEFGNGVIDTAYAHYMLSSIDAFITHEERKQKAETERQKMVAV